MCITPILNHYRIILILSFDINSSTIILAYDYTAVIGYINRTVMNTECDICFEDGLACGSAGYVCTRCSKYVSEECYTNNNKDVFKPCPYCNYSFKDYLNKKGCIMCDTYNRFN